MIIFANALFLKLRDKLSMLRMAAPGMATSDPTYFCWLWTSQKLSSYFADFEQVKKKTGNITPVGETGCLCIFFFNVFFGYCLMSLALHPGFSDL